MGRVSRRHIALGLLLCGAIAYLALVVKGASRSAAGNRPKEGASATDQAARAKREADDLKLPEQQQFARYQETIARNIFAPPASPKPPDTKKVLPPPPLKAAPKTVSRPKPQPPDLSGWSYVGYMVIGDQRIGVLQNDGNDSMKEVPLGSQFLGAEVESITSDEIVFTSPGGNVRLSTPRDFPVVSLSKSSAGAPSRPPRPSPARPSPPVQASPAQTQE